MTRLFAAIAAIVIAGGFFAGGVYLAETASPFMIQHARLMGFLGPAFAGIGAIATAIAAVRRRRLDP